MHITPRPLEAMLRRFSCQRLRVIASNIMRSICSAGINEPNVWLQLNPRSKMLEMLLTYQSGSKSAVISSTTTNYYQALHAYINPADYSVTSAKALELGRLSAYMRSHYDKDEFTGIPIEMMLNADGTSSIVMTEEVTQYTSHGSGINRRG